MSVRGAPGRWSAGHSTIVGVAVSGVWAGSMIWGQVVGSTPNPNSLTLLALRRWCSGLTLCSPAAVPGLFGLWAWLLGMAALLVMAMVFQGPVRALRQLFDV